jgi:putative flippase GtrA
VVGGATRGLRFIAIGTAAAATHYVVALATYSALGWSSGFANVTGYATAVPVSYYGHRFWTFDTTREPQAATLLRFLPVAALSFAANQTLLLLGVRWLPLPFWLVLGLVLVVVAVSTYLVSRWWVFKT